MLTFELADDGHRMEIHGDSEGLLKLASVLEALVSGKTPDHIHLMTEDWGGGGLTNDKQGLQNVLMNHVKIFVWPARDQSGSNHGHT